MTGRLGRPAVLHALVALGLLAVAAVLRAGPLAPSSLWLDDAWAALVSRVGVGEAVGMGLTAPGMAVLQWAVFRVAGFSELAAQALPFAFGVAGPALLYLVLVRHRLRPPAALVGAALLLASPVHLEFSSRVKQYTLDAVLVIGLLHLAWSVVEAPGRARRWAALAVGAGVAVALSASVVPVAGGGFLAGLVAAWRRDRAVPRPALLAGAGFGLFALAWWAVVLRPVLSPALREYWSGQYVPLSGGVRAAVSALGDRVEALFAGFSPVAPEVMLVAVLVAAVVVARRRPELAVLAAAPAVAAVGLAVAELAPLGGGRTDTYLYPCLALVVAVALDGLPRGVAWPVAVVALVGLVAAAPVPGPYPPEDLRPLVAELERARRPGDTVLVYSAARWAYGLYADPPPTIDQAPDRMPGFELVLADADAHFLNPGRERPEVYGAEVPSLVSESRRVWLVAAHVSPDIEALRAVLAAEGLAASRRLERPGAVLELWSRA